MGMNSNNFSLQNPQDVYELYYERGMSVEQISTLFAKPRVEVVNAMDMQDIPTKEDLEKAEAPTEKPNYHDRLLLIKMYWDEGLSLKDMTRKFRTDHTESIRYQMVKHDIPRRRQGRRRGSAEVDVA